MDELRADDPRQAGWYGPATAPAAPGHRRRRKPKRRSTWTLVTVAVVAVVGAAAGILAVKTLNRPLVPPPRPAGLTALNITDSSVLLSWTANATAQPPARYEILEYGKGIASVPGTRTSYQVTRLSFYSDYQFSVVAVTGALHSPESTVILASTNPPPAPPVADAVFNLTGTVTWTETQSSDDYWKQPGASWQDDWTVTGNCGARLCATAVLDGAISGIEFTATLHRSGSVYTGSAPINQFWYAGADTSKFTPSTLSFTLKVSKEGFDPQSRTYLVTVFSGTAVWNVPFDGFVASRYQMAVNGGQPAPLG